MVVFLLTPCEEGVESQHREEWQIEKLLPTLISLLSFDFEGNEGKELRYRVHNILFALSSS